MPSVVVEASSTSPASPVGFTDFPGGDGRKLTDGKPGCSISHRIQVCPKNAGFPWYSNSGQKRPFAPTIFRRENGHPARRETLSKQPS